MSGCCFYGIPTSDKDSESKKDWLIRLPEYDFYHCGSYRIINSESTIVKIFHDQWTLGTLIVQFPYLQWTPRNHIPVTNAVGIKSLCKIIHWQKQFHCIGFLPLCSIVRIVWPLPGFRPHDIKVYAHAKFGRVYTQFKRNEWSMCVIN